MNAEEKIKKIDNLLKNDELLEKYITNISNSDFDIPSDLTENILKKINKEEAKILQKAYKFNYFDILKIAICTLFALIIWQNCSTKTVIYASSNEKKEEIYTNIDSAMQSINNFFMKPVNIERREK